jgi:hypothetical protein
MGISVLVGIISLAFIKSSETKIQLGIEWGFQGYQRQSPRLGATHDMFNVVTLYLK